MYLSYSGFDTHDKCPFAYWNRYIGKTTPPVADNRVNMLYGSIVGVLFEEFYNERMWRLSDYTGELLARAPKIAQKIVLEETDNTRPGRNGVIRWKGPKKDGKDPKSNYESMDEVLVDVNDTIKRGLATIRYHRLVGPETQAEVKLDSLIEGHKIGGRADFLIRRVAPHNDRCLLDGKGSRTRHENVDQRQLRWYGMLYRHQHKVLPDRLGFLYWRSEPEASIDWVEVTPTDTDVLKDTVIGVCEAIEAKSRRLPIVPAPTEQEIRQEFPAQPSRDCKWCAYLSACEAGKRYEANKGKAPVISDEFQDETGVDDIGL